ncbi:MAG: hypothetical protein ACI9OJ_001078, partial [Myxococcota bacterium]
KGKVDSHLKKIKKNKDFEGIKEYDVTLEHNENYWFVLLRANPVCKTGYANDWLGRCKKEPVTTTMAGGDEPPSVAAAP